MRVLRRCHKEDLADPIPIESLPWVLTSKLEPTGALDQFIDIMAACQALEDEKEKVSGRRGGVDGEGSRGWEAGDGRLPD